MLEDWETLLSSIRKMENMKNSSKNARRKLEVIIETTIPIKKGTKKRSSFPETEAKSCEFNQIPKTKYTCIMKTHESTWQRLESSLSKRKVMNEDYIVSKGSSSITHFNLVHKFIPMSQEMKISDVKAKADKDGGCCKSVQIFGYVFHDVNGPNHDKHWRSSGSFSTKILRTLTYWTLVKKTVRGSSVTTWMGKKTVLNWQCLFVHRNKRLFLSVYTDDIKMTGKMQNMTPMWERLMNNVDLDVPTSFLDHVYLGCTQRECKSNEIIMDEYRKLIESRISAGATEKSPEWEKLHVETIVQSSDMKGHTKKCAERCWELTNKQKGQLYKISSPWLDDHHFKKRNLNQLEICQAYAHKLSWNTCIWNELIGLTFFGQRTNLLDQSAMHSFIMQVTSDNIVTLRTRLSIADFQDSDFDDDLEDSNSTSRGCYVSSEVDHSSPFVGCARNK